MAERRMLTKKITDADEFISLPSSTQALYLHLTMAADDDGFNNQVQMAMFKAHASVDDLRLLLAKRFIIQFSNGVIVIKHWRMANALRKDRYTATAYQEELKMLKIKDNGSYSLDDECSVAERLPDGCQVVAAGKGSIEEDSIDKNSIGEDNTPLTPQGEEWDAERHTNVQNFDHLVQTEMNEVSNTNLLECVRIWLQYKDGRKPRATHHYQLQSIRGLTNKVFEQAKIYGPDAVIGIVNDSIANNYSGITWNELERRRPKRETSGSQSSLEEWAARKERERNECK